MTRMSEPRCAAEPRTPRKRSTSQRSRGVVRHVQDSSGVLVLTLLRLSLLGAGACVIPPQLSVGGDGGESSPPAILSVSADDETLVAPGPVTFAVGQMPPSNAIVSLLDSDTTDTLYVRWFVDYSLNLVPQVECPDVAPNGMAFRSTTCNLESLCTDAILDATAPFTCDNVPCHDLQIIVFNHQPADPGTPPYQDVAPGQSTSVFYHLECEAS
jgi:hypothetical protein